MRSEGSLERREGGKLENTRVDLEGTHMTELPALEAERYNNSYWRKIALEAEHRDRSNGW